MGSGSGLFSLLKDRGHLKVNREQLSHRCPRIAIEGKHSLGVRKHGLLTPEKEVGRRRGWKSSLLRAGGFKASEESPSPP